MKQIAKGLSSIFPRAQALYSSPLLRAMQTSLWLTKVYGRKLRLQSTDSLRPGSDPSLIINMVKGVPERRIILVGHEPHLPRLLRAGGAGTICGVANVYPEVVRALLSPSVTASDEERIAKFIAILFEYPFLPAFKAIVAAQTADPGWRAVRPPWVELPEKAQRPLLAALESAGMRVSPARAV